MTLKGTGSSSAAAREPGNEPLGIELEVGREDFLDALSRQPAAVPHGKLPPQLAHAGADGRRPIRCPGALLRNPDEVPDLPLERLSQPRHVRYPAEMHE